MRVGTKAVRATFVDQCLAAIAIVAGSYRYSHQIANGNDECGVTYKLRKWKRAGEHPSVDFWSAAGDAWSEEGVTSSILASSAS